MGGTARVSQWRLAAAGGLGRVRARARTAREGLRVAGRASTQLRPRLRSGSGPRDPTGTARGLGRRGPRARRAIRTQGGRARHSTRRGQRTSRALSRRARAPRRGSVTAATRAGATPHLAATLLFAGSLALVAMETPAWCSVLAFAMVGWRLAIVAGLMRQPAATPPLRYAFAAVTALCVVAVLSRFQTLNGLAAGTALL